MDLQPKGLDRIPMSTIKEVAKELKALDNLHSVTQLKKVINAALFTCKLGSDVFEDGKLTITDLGSIISLLTNLDIYKEAISNIDKLSSELLDKITDEEVKEITDLFAKYEIKFLNKKSIIVLVNSLFNISENIKVIIETIKHYDN